MRPIFLLALVACGAARTADCPLTIVRELRTGPIRYSMQIGRLTEDQVTAAALQLLRPADVTFGRLVVYASRNAEMVIERESYLDHCSWERFLDDASSNGVRIAPGRCPEVSEVIKVGSSIVLRKVDAGCRVMRKQLLGNADPLWIRVGDTRHEIVAVSLKPLRSGESASERAPPYVNVFVRTASPLNTGLAKAILTRLKSVSGAEEMMVIVRNDVDFVRECTFPAPYLFGGPATLTALDATRHPAGAEVTCVDLDPWPLQCFSYQGE